MKKKSLLVLFLLIFTAGNSNSQTVHYWVEGIECILYPHYDRMIFRTAGDTLSKDLNDFLEEKGINIWRKDFTDTNYLGVLFQTDLPSDSIKIAEFMLRYQQDPEIIFADYYYSLLGDNDSSKVWPSGRTQIKFPENYSQSEKDSLIAFNNLTFIWENSFNYRYYSVPSKGNVWDIVNSIYENVPGIKISPSIEGEIIVPQDIVQESFDWPITISPNPANPYSIIRFSLLKGSLIKLIIYSIEGKKVATLIDGHLQAGSHSLGFDGSKLSSGVYIYRLEAEGLIKTGKILIMK